MQARIPFSGLYGSMFSDQLDRELEQQVEYLAQKHGVEERQLDFLHNHVVWGIAHEHVAEKYTDYFESWLNSGLGLSLKLTFDRMTSPRYYNFETDHIIVEISYEDAIKLARRVGRNALRKAAEALFTSRSGFISFYPSNPAEWGQLRSWDENHLYALFTAAAGVVECDDLDWEWGLVEAMSGNGVFSTAFDRAFDSEAVMLEIGKLLGKKELLEEQQEEEDRLYPTVWCGTQDYVAKYNALNQRVFNPYSDGVL